MRLIQLNYVKKAGEKQNYTLTKINGDVDRIIEYYNDFNKSVYESKCAESEQIESIDFMVNDVNKDSINRVERVMFKDDGNGLYQREEKCITAEEYTDNLYNALLSNAYLREFYSGEKGCKRLAREYGVGLYDYSSKEQLSEIRKSYAYICVRFYDLKPPIDNKVWVKSIMEGIKKASNI